MRIKNPVSIKLLLISLLVVSVSSCTIKIKNPHATSTSGVTGDENSGDEVGATEMAQVSDVTFDLPEGSYSEDQEVGMVTSTDGAEIHYIIIEGDDDPPVVFSNFSSRIPITGHGRVVTIVAYAAKDGMRDSEVVRRTFRINYDQVSTPSIDPIPGELARGTSVTITCVTPGVDIYYTTDDSDPTELSSLYDPDSKPTITSAVTLKAKAFRAGLLPSETTSAVYTISRKIYAAGSFAAYTNLYSRIIRVNSDGSIDTSFDVGAGITGGRATVADIAIQPDGKILIAGDFTLYKGVARNHIVRVNADGSVDTSFNPGVGADSNALNRVVLQSDGKIYVTGSFHLYNGVYHPCVVRLNSDGSLDSTFNVGFNTPGITGPSGYDVLIQPDGKILIGGTFSVYGLNGLIRVNSDGSQDVSFTHTATAGVYSLALQADGKILVGGQFATWNGVARKDMARINSDGSLDTSFNTGNYMYATKKIAVLGDGKIMTGDFSNRVARLNADGTTDGTFTGSVTNPGTRSVVFSFQADGQLLVNGSFSAYNGTARPYIARANATNGSIDISFDPGVGPNGAVNVATPQSDGKILLGGVFTMYRGTTTASNIVGASFSNGSLVSDFEVGAGANGIVYTSIVQSDDKILIGGAFTTYNGTSISRIARINTDGSLDASFTPGTGANNIVISIVPQSDDKFLIGGSFTSYNGTAYNRITRINSDGTLDTSFTPGTGANNAVYSIALDADGKILISGSFTSYNGTARTRIARINSDGTLDTSFTPGTGASSTIYTIAVQADGKILIGGAFTSYNGTARNRIARINSDGSLDTSFNPGTGVNASVQTIAAQADGDILIGGDFTTYNGSACGYIARINSDGSLDAAFNSGTGASASVRNILIQDDSKILIGGGFTTYNGTANHLVTRLNTDGSLDDSFIMDPTASRSGTVYSIAVSGN
ncbi:MAG: chitobiase/beta-hexosaminidase C-terminal domain-containing protein [Pseudomonadota bacterium]